jgi:plasmid maintenance system killer protein
MSRRQNQSKSPRSPIPQENQPRSDGHRLYAEDRAKGVPPDSVDKLRKMLAFLDDMQDPEELRSLPAWKVHSHSLTGDRKGTWSLSVTRNRRLTFPYRHG